MPKHDQGNLEIDFGSLSNLVSDLFKPAAVLSLNGEVVVENTAFKFVCGTVRPKSASSSVLTFLSESDRRLVEQLCSVDPTKNPAPHTTDAAWCPPGVKRSTFQARFTRLEKNRETVALLCQVSEGAFEGSLTTNDLMAGLDQGVWDYNLRSGRFGFSAGWRRLRGFADDHAVEMGKSEWLDHVHPDDREKLGSLLDGTQLPGENYVAQYRFKHTKGNWVWISCRASVVHCDKSGEPLRIIGFDTDISEKIETRESISQLSGKLKLAIDLSGIGIFEFNPDDRTVHWDDRMLEIYGVAGSGNLRANELWEDFLHPDDKAETVACADECRRLNKDFKRDYRIITPSGEVRHIRSVFQNVPVPNGSARLVGVNIDITEDYQRTQELEIARAQLEHDALHDKLTGLANRRALDQDAELLFNSLTDDIRYAVMHIDLDHFKLVNDTLGHAAGDHVLKHAGSLLQRIIGKTGRAYRLGGDEFGVLFERAPDEKVLSRLSQEIIDAIGRPITFSGEKCSVGASIGFAVEQGAPELQSIAFSKADTALYAAKRGGRNGFRAYTEEIGKAFHLHYETRKDLDKALCADQIITVLQPKFDAKSMKIVGAEALVRWQCPRRGLLAPAQFLPEAADAGLLAEIDHQVFSRVLALQSDWYSQGLVFPKVAINVSRARLEQDALLQQISAALEPHHKLGFELLETRCYDSPPTKILFTLDTLREMKISIEMDDFGTGQASVRALQALKPDAVKIDRSLVQPLGERSEQLKVLQNLSNIARIEGAQVVVEGLETGAHMAAIRMLDCDVLQGYVLQRPMSELEFTALLSVKPQQVAS